MNGDLATHCETCGQQLPEHDADGMWLPEPGGEQSKRSSSQGSGPDRRVVAGIAGLLLLWVAVIMVGRLVAPPNDQDDEVAQDTPTESVPTATAESGASLPVDEDLTDPGLPDQHNFVTRRIAMNNVQVERMKRHLDRRGSSPTIAYRAAEGIAFVHLARGVAEVAAVLDDGQITPGQRILRGSGLSVAIDTQTLVAATVADNASLVVAEARDGATYFVDSNVLEGSQSPIVQASSDGETLSRVVAPVGHQLVTFDGLGLVAISKGPAGGTQLATTESFEWLSDNRVLEANDRALLEQICESPLVCKLAVTDLETGEQWDVPPRFGRLGDTYYLAPDGGSLLRVTPEGFAEAYVASEKAVAWVIGQGMRSPAWGGQSNYVVWLDLVGEPNLKLMFVDDRDWLSIDLSALDAPLPIGPEFVIFESS